MGNPKLEQYQKDLVDTIVSNLEKDNDYIQKWSNIPFAPHNGGSNHEYQGINKVGLSMDLLKTHADDPRYYTFKQIKDLGLQLNKGSKGIRISYYNVQTREIEHKDGTTEEVNIPFVKLTTVFRAADINGLKPYEHSEGLNQLNDVNYGKELMNIVSNMGITLKHGANKACYYSSDDTINMPPPERFSSKEAYASTLLHELAHSSGHSSRLNRKLTGAFNSADYAKEELRAEIASVFMAQKLGISYKLENDQNHIDNSSAYVKSWIKVLKDDHKELFRAAADASKITNYLNEQASHKQEQIKENAQERVPNLSQ